MSEWNYNLEEAKKEKAVLVTRYRYGSGNRVVEVSWRDAKGDWVSSGVVAWMPLPGPAPLPEGD